MTTHLHTSPILAALVLLAASSLPALGGGSPAGPQSPESPEALATFVSIVDRVGGLSSPVGVTSAGDGSRRVFIVQQGGQIRIWHRAQGLLPTPFLNISGLITSGGEQGLLGLAFHPSYETNGFFYVNYTRSDGDAVVARYSVSAGNPNVADPASAKILFVVDDPFSNHNGGHLAFGPDGYLYIGLGDGGSGDDPCEYAQNLLWDFASTGGSCSATSHANRRTFWGKMLRIDVDQNVNVAPYYGIPPTNPYVGAGDPGDLIPDEIWARGLRNPWRYSFDRTTGDLYIGDVGQVTREEVTFVPAGTGSGANFGWDVLEGFFCHEDVPAGSCNTFLTGGSVLPALDYPRSDGSTVIGGHVYRGRPASQLLTGKYVFADIGSGRMWQASRDGGGNWSKSLLFQTTFGPSSFGEGDNGELYVVGLSTGHLYQVTPFSFADVPPTHFAWPFVEPLLEAAVTSGCGGDNFCPDAATTRGQMAVFLLRTRFGSAYTPPACSAASFSDVPCSHPLASWIYDLAARGVTGGCGGGRYCPDLAVSRDQMAVFLLRTLDTSINPVACNPSAPMFADMPASNGFCRWVEELARRGISAGCGGGNYCPAAAVSRGGMAVFLVTTYGLIPI